MMPCDMPPHVRKYFSTRGTGPILTPKDVVSLVGTSRIQLHKYDIWVCGKKKNQASQTMYTRLRILSKENETSSLQGLLEVDFLQGHGFDKLTAEGSDTRKVMRCANISREVTEDEGSFKKRAVIDIKDTAICLDRADAFLKVPLMDHRVLSKFERSANTKKRYSYRAKKEKSGRWKNMVHDNDKILQQMLLPYKNNMAEDEYFAEFLRDMIEGCRNLQRSFCLDVVDEVDIFRMVFSEKFPSLKRSRDENQVRGFLDSDDSTRSKVKVPRLLSKKHVMGETTSLNTESLKKIPATKFRM